MGLGYGVATANVSHWLMSPVGVPLVEPLLPLGAGAVGPGLRGHPARRGLLDPVIAHGRGGGEGILQVPFRQRIQERLARGLGSSVVVA